MRDINEVLKDDRVKIIWRNIQNDKAIQVKIDLQPKGYEKFLLVKFTKAMGWEHLCASFKDETPSWDTMNELKELFWLDDEVCFQLHPKKEDYINNNDHCLHIWRNIEEEFKCPPYIMVGFRDNKEKEDKQALKEMQEALGNPLSDSQIDHMYKMSTGSKNEKESYMKEYLNGLSLQDLLKML